VVIPSNDEYVFTAKTLKGAVCYVVKPQAEVIQNHENENVRYNGQGEAPHRKFKRLKLGGGHVYNYSSV
jgi:hypothetical protein